MGSDTNTTTLGIADLRDIVLPDPVPWWPPAPGVWVLSTIILVAALVLVWGGVRHRRRHAYRRAGLEELTLLESRLYDPTARPAALRDLSVLLKRVALVAYPRETVASLYGEPWLHYLDERCPGCSFSGGPGFLLLQGLADTRPSLETNDNALRDLVAQSRLWIARHQPTESVNPEP